jgi:hypothetical protein
VLIVDDDAIGGRALSRYVYMNVRCPVRLVTSLSQLQAVLTRCAPATAILLDYQLGMGVSGLDAMNQIREFGWASACAFVTGASQELRAELAERDEQHPVFERGGEVSSIVVWVRNALGRGGSGTYPRILRNRG